MKVKARDNPRRPEGFARMIGISVSKLYILPSHLQPSKIKLGTATVITETPEEYLRRIAAQQRSAK
jgi:hypothetical protein